MPHLPRAKKTAIVKIAGYCSPKGNYQYSLDWGFKDHKNNFTTSIFGVDDVDQVELLAARQAIKIAYKQKYTRVRIITGSQYVWDLIKNSANFANAPPEVLHIVQSIHAYKESMTIQVQLEMSNGNESGVELAENVENMN